MSFALFSLPVVLAGVAALAAGLWFLQRLRVRHREVEVVTGMFWQAVTEETRARVFVRRFRHWRAWLLLSTICSLLWLLLCQPQFDGTRATRHVVLMDGSIDDAEVRKSDLELALRTAGGLPPAQREIVVAGTHLQSILRPNEPLPLARRRVRKIAQQASGINSGIVAFSQQSSPDSRMTIHLIGDAPVDQRIVDQVSSERMRLVRVPRNRPVPNQTGLVTLGQSPAKSGLWDRVDVRLKLATRRSAESSEINAADVAILLDGETIDAKLQPIGESSFVLVDLPAQGQILQVAFAGQAVGQLTLPVRNRIRVAWNGDVPASLQKLIELDPACQIVTDEPDITIGTADDADFQLTDGNAAAFHIFTETGDPNQALNRLVDELALRQVDSTRIAQKSGRVIDVRAETAPRRKLAIWNSLFSAAYDFRESRACPVVVSRAVRWLAGVPSFVEYAVRGERLPMEESVLRGGNKSVQTSDGRELVTTRLLPQTDAAAALEESTAAIPSTSPFLWLGLILASLMTVEWVSFQKGRLP